MLVAAYALLFTAGVGMVCVTCVACLSADNACHVLRVGLDGNVFGGGVLL